MTFNVNIELGYAFKVKAGAAEVFEVLSDVPTSASFFPDVDKLVNLGENTYRWEMAKIGLGSINLQTVYASKYTSDKGKGSVVCPKDGSAMHQCNKCLAPGHIGSSFTRTASRPSSSGKGKGRGKDKSKGGSRHQY